MTRFGSSIQTYTGIEFYALDPRVEEIEPADIVHALSCICRFGGHARRFYSVAEHSVLVASKVSPEARLAALLHDAAEAYLGDVPRPIKKSISQIAEWENAILRCVWARFGISPTDEILAEVRRADDMALATESEQIMTRPIMPFPGWDDVKIRCLSPEVAEREFALALLNALKERN